MKSIKHESQILFRPALGVRSTQTLVKIYNKRYLVKLFAQVYSQVNKSGDKLQRRDLTWTVVMFFDPNRDQDQDRACFSFYHLASAIK